MNDTAPEVSEYLRSRYSAMKPEKRFLFGFSMFDTARALVEASISPELSGIERRREICRRLYPALAEQVFPQELGSDPRA